MDQQATNYETVLRDIIASTPKEMRPVLDVSIGRFFLKNHVRVSLSDGNHNSIIISRWDIQEGESESEVKEKACMGVLRYIFIAGITNPNGVFTPQTTAS